MPEKIVIIPTYNEKDNIASMIDAVMALHQGYHILVIDDGSPDGTADIVRASIEKYPNEVFLEERRGKLGLGTAYIHGFKWCLQRDYAFIFEMDADFSHDPKDLERLYQACKQGNADVSIGSRYVKGGQTENWPLDRQLYSRGGALYTKLLTWMPIQDPTAGFVCYKKEVLEAINFDMISFVGYAFQIEMKFTAYKCGFTLMEVPIIFINRELGTSKMSGGIFSEAFLGVIKLKINSWFRKFPKRK